MGTSRSADIMTDGSDVTLLVSGLERLFSFLSVRLLLPVEENKTEYFLVSVSYFLLKKIKQMFRIKKHITDKLLPTYFYCRHPFGSGGK